MNSATLVECLSWLPFRIYKQIMGRFNMTPRDYLGTIIDPIKPSTITLGGTFTNVVLNEKEDILKFAAEPPICMIGSNFGEVFAEGYKPPEKKTKVSKRGRKPKIKDKKKRIQGSGKYFNSQITFVVQSSINAAKIYKFKVFRNGIFQVPGVLRTDQNDIEIPLTMLKTYFSSYYKTSVDVIDRTIQMRNCKTVLNDLNLNINTLMLGSLITQVMKTDNDMNIYKVEYQTAQNSCKVVVKFLRPKKDKPFKQTTLKILRQKINFEGAVDFNDIFNIYWWLNDLILDNYDTVINDPDTPELESDSSDTDESSDDEAQEASTSFEFNPYSF